MTLETRAKLNFLLSQYKSKYEKYYPKSEFEFVMENFVKDFGNEDGITSLLLQAYEECGLSDELPRNLYGNFIRHIKADCDINQDLLEVGCGIIPSLAKSLKKQQTSGTITVMDPLISIPKYGNLRIIQENFTKNTDVSNYSLIYGAFPCRATIPMINSSFENDVDMYVLLCGCTAGTPFFSYKAYLYDLEHRMQDFAMQTGRNFEIFEYEDLPLPLIKTFR